MPRPLLVRHLSIYFRSSVPWQGTLLHPSAILLVFLLTCFRFAPLLLLRRPYGVSPSMSSSFEPHRSSPILMHNHRRIERPNSDESFRVVTSPQLQPIMSPSAKPSLEFLLYTLIHVPVFQPSPQSFGFCPAHTIFAHPSPFCLPICHIGCPRLLLRPAHA
jgi:hypothetical protein